jgi:hypothetical protein
VRTISRAILAAAGLLLLSAATASAQNNFVANGNFDTSAGSWTRESSTEVAIAFDAALGDPAPGSMRLTNSSTGPGNGIGVIQCLGAVTVGKSYTWGGRMFLPSGQQRTGPLFLGLRWRSGPGCTGNDVDQPRLSTNLFNTWIPLSANQVAPAGAASVQFVAFPSKVEAGGSLIGNFDSLFFRQADGLIPPCVADAITLCLNNNRFSVTATWRTDQGAGAGTAIPLTSDTGSFWFFSANNLEGIFKLVNGCAFNNFYWFFGGGLTNVEVTLRVFDRQTGLARVYQNPISTAFLPIQDTAGYPCP